MGCLEGVEDVSMVRVALVDFKGERDTSTVLSINGDIVGKYLFWNPNKPVPTTSNRVNVWDEKTGR